MVVISPVRENVYQRPSFFPRLRSHLNTLCASDNLGLHFSQKESFQHFLSGLSDPIYCIRHPSSVYLGTDSFILYVWMIVLYPFVFLCMLYVCFVCVCICVCCVYCMLHVYVLCVLHVYVVCEWCMYVCVCCTCVLYICVCGICWVTWWHLTDS